MANTIETLSPARQVVVGVQYLFVAFGATVLVPLLVGLDPSAALFSAGIGTLIFHLVTKGKVPIYLGSSFAFIAPLIAASELYGVNGALLGIVGVAFVFLLMSFFVKLLGTKFINRLFPPVVIGPVIMLIGLSLSGAGVNMAKENWLLAIVSLITAIVVTLYAKGLMKLIPIFCGIIVGYLTDIIFFDVDFTQIAEAKWFALPALTIPKEFSWEPILFMIPVAIAPVIEHIGDVYVVGTIAGKNFVKDPGLHRTLLGDGLACLTASFLGAPPVTTYSEVTGAMSLTKVTMPRVLRVTAITAILFSLVGKVSALLKSIDPAILGGIMLLLFGTIAGAGINNLLNSKVNLSSSRNIVIISVTLTTGIGGALLQMGSFTLSGIGLSALIAVLLNLLLPETEEDRRPTISPQENKGER
ncbi:MAG: uracil-xanthine permease family protein [Bacteroidales bacterium]|uniref:uracil-xanthine permease family protein n=1 Tax=Porphyromonas sp. TaxID=1924944 RepID=UPI0029748FCA|nr:uracil-xanthine permease family protein [Porphyromonas sp.]MDD7438425.1 uracil-xanthine permease family protein [Bacteroidales bacterium]MDY3067539.1 uracil-xanthine permease family protein [Porphyromonas sp.]